MTEKLEALDMSGAKTYEQMCEELQMLEAKLASELGLVPFVIELGRSVPVGIRDQLRALDRAGKLPETELVADWRQDLSAVLWLKELKEEETRRGDEEKIESGVPDSRAVSDRRER